MTDKGQILIKGGTFLMGSEYHYLEEQPVVEKTVADFWIDANLVTNAEYTRFVDATGYITMAERPLSPELYPDLEESLLKPGSFVFIAESSATTHEQWWHWVTGANWRQPQGPGSTISDKMQHPVTQLQYCDVMAFCHWCGKDLPTEAEWEYAARGGLEGSEFAWESGGNEVRHCKANVWRGAFPHSSDKPQGQERTSEVGSYPPNGFGIYDMIGNVWEWTKDNYVDRHSNHQSCCSHNSAGSDVSKVIKGGSYLCSPEYCFRYRPAARIPHEANSATDHIGFRCVIRS